MLDPLRARIRRFQLIVGLGLLSAIVGAMLSIPIMFRILPELDVGIGVFEAVRTLISQLWAYAVIPLLLYGTARIIELRPWSAAIGTVVTALVFQTSITLISKGFEGWFAEHPARHLTVLLTLAAGVVLGHRAVLMARAHSDQRAAEAKKAAEARKDEYAEFAREAERLAAKSEDAKSEEKASETSPAAEPQAEAGPNEAPSAGAEFSEVPSNPDSPPRTGT